MKAPLHLLAVLALASAAQGGSRYWSAPGSGFRSYARPIPTRLHAGPPRATLPSHSTRVWIPGRVEWVRVPPRHGVVHDACGRPRRVLLEAGGWRQVQRPGRWEVRSVPVLRCRPSTIHAPGW